MEAFFVLLGRTGFLVSQPRPRGIGALPGMHHRQQKYLRRSFLKPLGIKWRTRR